MRVREQGRRLRVCGERHGRAVQLDSIMIRVDIAYGYSACSYNTMNGFQHCFVFQMQVVNIKTFVESAYGYSA